MENGCPARLRLKPTSGHGGNLDARVARNQPREGRREEQFSGRLRRERRRELGRRGTTCANPLLGGAITHAGESPLRLRPPPADQPVPTPRPAARSLSGQARKAPRDSRSENDTDPRRARPSSVLLVAPPIPPPPRTWSFTLAFSEFLTGGARPQLFVPSTNPERQSPTAAGGPQAGLDPLGEKRGDGDEQSYPRHLWEGGGNGCLYFSSSAAGKGKRHKGPCAAAVVAVEVRRCVLSLRALSPFPLEKGTVAVLKEGALRAPFVFCYSCLWPPPVREVGNS